MKIPSLLRFAITAVVVVVAALLGHALWRHYMYSPWTRDGRVRAEVVRIAPDVSGLVTQVAVVDNQQVKKGDLLFTIDKSRFEYAVAQAQANLAAAEASARADGRTGAVPNEAWGSGKLDVEAAARRVQSLVD